MKPFKIALLPFGFARTPIGILFAITLFALAWATSFGQNNDKKWSAKIPSMKERLDTAVAAGKMTKKQESRDEATEQSDPWETPATFALSVAKTATGRPALAEVGSALVKAGEFDQAIAVAKTIEFDSNSNFQETNLGGIALALVEAGEPDKASASPHEFYDGRRSSYETQIS